MRSSKCIGLNGKLFVSSQKASNGRRFTFLWMQHDSSIPTPLTPHPNPAVRMFSLVQSALVLFWNIIPGWWRLHIYQTLLWGWFNTWLSQSTHSNTLLFCCFISGCYCNLGFVPCNGILEQILISRPNWPECIMSLIIFSSFHAKFHAKPGNIFVQIVYLSLLIHLSRLLSWVGWRQLIYANNLREKPFRPPSVCSRTSNFWCGGVQLPVLGGHIGHHSGTVLLSRLPTLSLL